MSVSELFLIAVGLSMDAFAVAVCKGLTNHDANSNSKLKKSIIVALYFGIFQALMPLIGYLLGSQFREKIESVDHWIAFVLLLIIGGKMIWESFGSKSESDSDGDVSFKTMLPLAIATSIDALAVGITFAFLQVDIIPAISFIGIITFILSLIGVEIGKLLGHKFCSKAEFGGGAILVLIGTKTLLEHLGIINF